VAAAGVARSVIASDRDQQAADRARLRREEPDFLPISGLQRGLTLTESAHMFRALSAGRRASL